ncbi:MAG: NAD(P)H-hydrate dehydratase [Lutibacter sp.]|jgi:hydroxyethylthiazole kinase-like uncharacterized protein yjeF|nr:NAD(P)H-hydrate dehydratase [Lutibacter sp.]
MYILSSKEMVAADKATMERQQISSTELMEQAASRCFQQMTPYFQGQFKHIHVCCGPGNNGGDGLVISRQLYEQGLPVTAYLLKTGKNSADFIYNHKRLQALGQAPKEVTCSDDFPLIDPKDLVIDALFGNGLHRTPGGLAKTWIGYLNDSGATILSIDLPSGLFVDQPVTDKASVIHADHVFTFECPKIGLLLPDNKDFVKRWEVVDIGLDKNSIEALHPSKKWLDKMAAKPLYRPRKQWGHKGNYGHALIIGGSFGKIGALTLATKGALYAGSGLVTAYLPKCGYEILQVSIPEAMTEVDDDKTLTYFNVRTQATVIGIGPGMGTGEKTAIGFDHFIRENTRPLVVDADAINLLSKNPELYNYLPENTVLTPHPKELERLIGSWKNDYEKLEKAREFSKKYQLILVIKDAYTCLIKGDSTLINATGNPALSTGGSGDVLTGMITGLIAQGYKPWNAAALGVYLHGHTADIAVREGPCETFRASDILHYLPTAWRELSQD